MSFKCLIRFFSTSSADKLLKSLRVYMEILLLMVGLTAKHKAHCQLFRCQLYKLYIFLFCLQVQLLYCQRPNSPLRAYFLNHTYLKDGLSIALLVKSFVPSSKFLLLDCCLYWLQLTFLSLASVAEIEASR
jgi:hypothetical protein